MILAPTNSTQQTGDRQPGEVVLGGFELLRKIGEGSFASVYLAHQQGTERQAVVKIAHKHLVGTPLWETIQERFKVEFKASTRIQHPHIPTVFMVGDTSDGLPSIAMEFVPGRSLHTVLHQYAPLRPRATLTLLRQLLDTLNAIHKAGIIHQDVTPSNIMLLPPNEDGELTCKLIDFGIARLQDDNATANPMGTLRYTAPERLERTSTPKSDLYSLGAVLWWAVTGQEHFAHVETAEQLVEAHRAQRRPPPTPPASSDPAAVFLGQLTSGLLHPDPRLRLGVSETLFLIDTHTDPSLLRPLGLESRAVWPQEPQTPPPKPPMTPGPKPAPSPTPPFTSLSPSPSDKIRWRVLLWEGHRGRQSSRWGATAGREVTKALKKLPHSLFKTSSPGQLLKHAARCRWDVLICTAPLTRSMVRWLRNCGDKIRTRRSFYSTPSVRRPTPTA